MTEEKSKKYIPSTRADLDRYIRRLTVETLMLDDIDPDSINPQEQDFLIALGANSIDALELMISVEEHLGFEFEDDELNPELVVTLDHFVSVICQKLGIPA